MKYIRKKYKSIKYIRIYWKRIENKTKYRNTQEFIGEKKKESQNKEIHKIL